MTVNWLFVKNFSPEEFPEDPDKYADPDLIHTLQKIRKIYNQPIYPSPAGGALARFDHRARKSQHYAVNRKSTAIDVFPEGYSMAFLVLLCSFHEIKGIGLYRDTRGPDGTRWPMFHIDMRPRGLNEREPIFWITLKDMNGLNAYHYPFKNPAAWELLKSPEFHAGKQYRAWTD